MKGTHGERECRRLRRPASRRVCCLTVWGVVLERVSGSGVAFLQVLSAGTSAPSF